jgi:transposase-like protein
MVTHVLHCPYYQGTDIARYRKTPQGKQRDRCRETACPRGIFLLDYSYPGQSLHIKEQIVDIAMNASGIHDTARVLHVRSTTVIKELKKAPDLQQVNQAVLTHLHPTHVEVELCRVDELEERRGARSELDEMWSYVGKKTQQRWL